MVNEEAKIHKALLLKLKKILVPFHVKVVAVDVAFLTLSGNISVKPQSLSARVSSMNSLNKNAWIYKLIA